MFVFIIILKFIFIIVFISIFIFILILYILPLLDYPTHHHMFHLLLLCPKCGSEMKVIAIITDLQEVDKILECLKRNNAPPFDKVVTKVS